MRVRSSSSSDGRRRGSHAIFVKEGERSITVPVHNDKAGRRYLDQICGRLGLDELVESCEGMMRTTKPLADYLAMQYPFKVVADPEAGYFIEYPDLPGCMTQVQRAEEIGPMAEEIRALWMETEYNRGADIPAPSASAEYSGKFVVRLPKSLHRRLAEAAELDGVSLNQFVVMLLERGTTLADVQRQIKTLITQTEQAHQTELMATSAD